MLTRHSSATRQLTTSCGAAGSCAVRDSIYVARLGFSGAPVAVAWCSGSPPCGSVRQPPSSWRSATATGLTRSPWSCWICCGTLRLRELGSLCCVWVLRKSLRCRWGCGFLGTRCSACSTWCAWRWNTIAGNETTLLGWTRRRRVVVVGGKVVAIWILVLGVTERNMQLSRVRTIMEPGLLFVLYLFQEIRPWKLKFVTIQKLLFPFSNFVLYMMDNMFASSLIDVAVLLNTWSLQIRCFHLCGGWLGSTGWVLAVKSCNVIRRSYTGLLGPIFWV